MFEDLTCNPFFRRHTRGSFPQSDVQVKARSLQEKKNLHVNLREMPVTPAGCPWDTRRDKHGVYRPVSQGFPVIDCRKTDRKGRFCRGAGGTSRAFSEILCDLFFCAFVCSLSLQCEFWPLSCAFLLALLFPGKWRSAQKSPPEFTMKSVCKNSPPIFLAGAFA